MLFSSIHQGLGDVVSTVHTYIRRRELTLDLTSLNVIRDILRAPAVDLAAH